MKLGPNIDTYLASMLLSEVRGTMPDEASERAVGLALDKVIAKIERRYRVYHGPFEGVGWAPILAQAMSGKGLNRARQAGVRVSDLVLAQAEHAARIAYRTGSWPRTISRATAMDSAGTSLGASSRPTTTGGVPVASVGSSLSAAGAGDEAAVRGSPGAAVGAARDEEGAGRRSMLGGARPAPRRPRPGMTPDDPPSGRRPARCPHHTGPGGAGGQWGTTAAWA